MALSTTVDWHVVVDGDDLNGGGYKTNANKVDYSQQSHAELILSDLSNMSGSAVLTSAVGGFTSNMVGNIIQISSGNNLTPGFYEIVSYTNTNTVNIDRTCAISPDNMSDGYGRVGGALATPGKACGASMNNDHHYIYVASGNYYITSDVANVSNGKIDFISNSYSKYLIGYKAGSHKSDYSERPVFIVDGVSDINVIKLNGNINKPHQVINILVNGNNNSNITCFRGNNGRYDQFYFCKSLNCYDGFYAGNFVSSSSFNCVRYGFYSGYVRFCYAYNCDKGFQNLGVITFCISDSCNVGFTELAGWFIDNCLAYNCSSHGYVANYYMTLMNCLAINCGGYGFASYSNDIYINCGVYNNSSGNFLRNNRLYATTVVGLVTLTTNPFVNPNNGDFRLNNVDGGGKLLRKQGVAIAEQFNNKDIGPVQHSDQYVLLRKV